MPRLVEILRSYQAVKGEISSSRPFPEMESLVEGRSAQPLAFTARTCAGRISVGDDALCTATVESKLSLVCITDNCRSVWLSRIPDVLGSDRLRSYIFRHTQSGAEPVRRGRPALERIEGHNQHRTSLGAGSPAPGCWSESKIQGSSQLLSARTSTGGSIDRDTHHQHGPTLGPPAFYYLHRMRTLFAESAGLRLDAPQLSRRTTLAGAHRIGIWLRARSRGRTQDLSEHSAAQQSHSPEVQGNVAACVRRCRDVGMAVSPLYRSRLGPGRGGRGHRRGRQGATRGWWLALLGVGAARYVCTKGK